MAQEKKSSAQYSSLTGIHRAVPIILFAVAVFTMFCYITQDIGALGRAISTVFLGLFSVGAYAIPLLLTLHAVFYPADISEKKVLPRVIFSLVAITLIAAITYAITYWNTELTFNPVEYFKSGCESIGGGFIGGIVAFCLIKIFGRVGLIILAAAVLTIYVSYCFSASKKKVASFFYNALKFIVILLAYTELGIKSFFKKLKNSKKDKLQREATQKNTKLSDDDFFAVDNGMQKLSVSELGIKETRDASSAENNPTLHDKIFYKSAVTPEEAEKMAMREKMEEMYYANVAKANDEPAPARRGQLIETTYTESDTAHEEKANEPVAESAPSFAPAASTVADESADAVFTQNFDPFSMMMSEELASKPSSRSLLDESAQPKKIKEDISELTEAELEREKRILEFERRKASIIGSRRAIPVDNDGEFTGTPKTVAFRERNDESLGDAPVETSASSFTFDKIERVAEPPVATPANYTPIGFGDDEDSFSSTMSKPAFTVPETIYSYDPPKEEAPKQSSYTVYESPVNETVPASVAYVEEPEVQIYERKSTVESYEKYAQASEPAPTVTEPILPEEDIEEEVKTFTMNPEPEEVKDEFSYTATKDFEEEGTEEYVPEFKPYQVFTPEDISESDAEIVKYEDMEEEEVIKATAAIDAAVAAYNADVESANSAAEEKETTALNLLAKTVPSKKMAEVVAIIKKFYE